MYKVMMSTSTGLDEYDIGQLEKGCWIDVIAPTEEELDQIAQATHIYKEYLTAPLDKEEKSRTELDEDQLGIIITPEVIVTVCLESNAVTADFNAHTFRNFCTYKKTRFLFQILYKSATLYLKYIRNIIRRTDDLEQHLRQAMENSKLFSMLDLQKSLTYFTTSLRSNYMVTEKLLRLRTTAQSQKLVRLYEEDEDLLEDVIVEYKQAIEMVEMYGHILNSMMEVFATIISNNLNLVMRFLASITIVLAIPTLISGLWGMNVPVPFAEVSFGFFIVLFMAMTVSLLAGFWLWKKHMF